MNEISGINSRRIGRVDAPDTQSGARRTADTPQADPARGADRVEVSSLARALETLKANPVRQDVVDRVRSEIANGTYEAPEKVEKAIAEILGDLNTD